MKLGPEIVVFVTGGASGLGEAAVRYLLSKGCKVAIADQNEDRIEELVKELGGVNIAGFSCDVTEEEDVKNAVAGAVKRFGTVHAAICSAGVAFPVQTYTDKAPMNTEMFQLVMDINVMGSVYVAKYASIHMAKNKPVSDKGEKGCIIFVSSIAADEGQRGQIAYGASKAALNGMLVPMSRDLGKFGIRVASI